MKKLVDPEILVEDGVEAPQTKFKYKVFGPIRISKGQDLSSTLIGNDFWDDLDEEMSGLRKAIGIYVFVNQASHRSILKPWYVGRTENSFEGRFHEHRKLFSRLLSKNGKLAVFLIARIDRKTLGFMKKRKTLESNDVLETMLIERCIDQNSKLFNAAKIKFVRGLVVPGFKNAPVGKPNLSARELSNMLSGNAPEEF